MDLSFVTLDVFTTTRFTGNPLAVVTIPKGQDVATERLQLIARDFNLSETVFIYEGETIEDDIPEWRVRIFMTNAELPFAGHPTIGTAVHALGTMSKGQRKARFICNAGPIELDYADSIATASIPHNVHVHRESTNAAEEVFELQPTLRPFGEPRAIDTVSPVKGMNFVCVELSSVEALAAATTAGGKFNFKFDREWNVGFEGHYFYVITKEVDRRLEVRTRMIFSNSTLEDPATGSAACGLSAFLAMKHKLKHVSLAITQGVEMGQRSEIGVAVTLKDSLDSVEKVELSGSAVQVMEGKVRYD